MTHTLIGMMGVACFACTLPLAAHAADESLAMPNPLSASASVDYRGDVHSMLRVKSGTVTHNGNSPISPSLFGPNALPNWKVKDLSSDFVKPRLEGERFRFR